MTQQEIQNEIALLKAENVAINVKAAAVGLVGSVAGLMYAVKQKKSNWAKFGYFLAGGYLGRLPVALFYTSKLAENITRIDILQQQLDTQNF